MPELVRALNDEGIQKFEQYLENGAIGGIPSDLLSDDETSYEPPWTASVERKEFADRFEFGEYLNTALKDCDQREISHHRDMWTWLALFYFDQLCPADAKGSRKPYKSYRYVYDHNYKYYYRHQVRTPYALVKDNGQSARVLLRAPLNRHGELVEQIASRQKIAGCGSVMDAIDGLYYDEELEKAKLGVTTRNRPGVILRLINILEQFETTYDLHSMSGEEILEMLPHEFDKWEPPEAA